MKKYILILAALSFAAFSCSDENDDPVSSNDKIEVSLDTLSFGPEGGQLGVKITSSGDWRVSGLCDWASPLAESGKSGETLTFDVLESSSMSSQKAVFKVFTGSAVKSVVLMQNPAYVIDLTSDEEVSFTSDGGSASVNVTTNVESLEFEFSDGGADWISYDSRSEAFGSTILKFNVDRSQAFKARESTITIKGEGNSATVKFTQAQRDTILVDAARVVYDLQARDIELTFKTNVEFTISGAGSWMTTSSDESTGKGADGLLTRTIKAHLDEAVASRQSVLDLVYGKNTLLKFIVKQQNPNPILCDIADANLRTKLNDLGWVLADESSTECEVLEAGLTGTSLSLAGSGYYYNLEVETISGLGAFPKLETLSIQQCNVKTIDVSDCKALTTISMNRVYEIREIKTGDSPVTSVDFGTYSYDYFNNETVTISGNNIETISMNSSSYYIYYGYDMIRTLDVTGCPALKTLKAKREYSSSWAGNSTSLKTINMTAAQKAAVDAGTLTVDKSDSCEIVVK